jgi:hypothetical protein
MHGEMIYCDLPLGAEYFVGIPNTYGGGDISTHVEMNSCACNDGIGSDEVCVFFENARAIPLSTVTGSRSSYKESVGRRLSKAAAFALIKHTESFPINWLIVSA